MALKPVKVGIIGCGNISTAYLRMCKTLEILQVVAVADIVPERASEQATAHHIQKACLPEELLADPEVELVINLTIPGVHGTVGVAALAAGKSVYNEKPLAITRADGQHMLQLAAAKGLRVGCAPDTFLGGGLQTCRRIIDEGLIGTPVAATAFMLSHGPENWHPNPDFFYQVGAGPMFDMGPYYLTALVTLLGPVRRVTGSARITTPARMITSQPRFGETITVNTPTHVAGVLDFTAGAIATLVTSFDIWSHTVPRLEIYGTEGTLSLPDPNTFGGPVRIRRSNEADWQEMPLTHGFTDNSRGIGVAEMAYGLRTGRPHRASGELAYHVLDLMHAMHDSSVGGHHIELQSTCARPAPLTPREGQQSLVD
ncbi:MAG: Gfo/Idh/MocA family oxidoreductase [Herpetosiphon sp.]